MRSVEAHVVAVLELEHDVLVVERLAAGQDDTLEHAPRVVRGPDVAPHPGAPGLEARAGPALVALEGIVGAHDPASSLSRSASRTSLSLIHI